MDPITAETAAASNNYVFVSHSSADRKLVEKIVHQIEKRGIKCWISFRDIKPGRDYQQEIVANLENSAVFLLIFTQHANSNSTEILKELSLAGKFKKPIIPARTEDIVPIGAFQYQLSNAQIIDLFDNFDKKIQDLCDSITEYIAVKRNPSTTAVPVARQSDRRGLGRLLAASGLGFVVIAGAAFAILRHGTAPNQSATTATSKPVAAKIIATTPVIPPQSPAATTPAPPPIAPPTAAPNPAASVTAVPPPLKPNHPTTMSLVAPTTRHAVQPMPPIATKGDGAGEAITTRYPAAKIIAWFPASTAQKTAPNNLLGSKDPVWTVAHSKTGQIRLTILLSPHEVALNHILLRVKPSAGTAVLPNKAVINLSNSRTANADSFRYVVTCALKSPVATRCDFGSQYARAITVELFINGKTISNAALSIGF